MNSRISCGHRRRIEEREAARGDFRAELPDRVRDSVRRRMWRRRYAMPGIPPRSALSRPSAIVSVWR